jgi:hypothetical protein
MHDADLHAALDKHQDDVLHLLWMGTMAGQNMISKKMLTKFHEANMTTMTHINTLIACAGIKELSTWRLKGLGSIAKHAAMELYDTKFSEQKDMEQEPPANIDAPVTSDVMIAGQESPVVSCKHGTQDVCTVNKVRKYPSMCKKVESVHAAVETQRRIFC